jgi:hypothetical protein
LNAGTMKVMFGMRGRIAESSAWGYCIGVCVDTQEFIQSIK